MSLAACKLKPGAAADTDAGVESLMDRLFSHVSSFSAKTEK